MGRAPNFSNSANKKRPPGTLRKDGTQTVRFEMPFAVWCHTCKPHAIIGQGVRFNAEKKKVGYYYSTPIWSFKLKHTACGGFLEIRTDPQNTAYVVTEGGKARDYGDAADSVREGEDGRPILTVEERQARREDAFARLEDKVEEKAQIKDNTRRIAELYEAQDKDWDDPWTLNKRMRSTFRRERKIRKREEEATDALKERLGTDIDLLPGCLEDAERAKLVSFGEQPEDSTSDNVSSKTLFQPTHRPPRPTKVVNESQKDLLQRQLIGNTRAAMNPFVVPSKARQ